MSAIRLVDVDGAGDAVERDVPGHHVRDETCPYAGTRARRPRVNLRLKGITNHEGQRTAASASAGGRDAVDCARPGLEVHAGAQVRLDLWVEADQLFAKKQKSVVGHSHLP